MRRSSHGRAANPSGGGAPRMDIARNPLKQATGWVAEKASRVKFSGAGVG